jgi:hypothetical protein
LTVSVADGTGRSFATRPPEGTVVNGLIAVVVIVIVVIVLLRVL